MLSFNIAENELSTFPLWNHTTGQFGSGYIRPFDHKALESFSITCPSENKFCFIVREKDFSFSAGEETKDPAIFPLIVDSYDYHAIVQATQTWPLNFICIEILYGNAPVVEISRGAFATAPLYLTSIQNQIIGSWDAFEICDRLKPIHLNPDYVPLLIGRESFTTPSTPIQGMWQLPDRGKFSFSSAGLKIIQPQNESTLSPRLLKPDVDVLATYNDLLKQNISRWLSKSYTHVGIQLSGGLDSSGVAVGLRQVWEKSILSYGILFAGEPGQQQQQRRAEMISKLDLDDHCFEGKLFPPLSAIDTDVNWPEEELYAEAFRHLINLAQQDKTEIIFTGFGGDELTPLFDFELKPLPSSHTQTETQKTILTDDFRFLHKTLSPWTGGLLDSSIFLAHMASSRNFLKKGIWLASPLSTPHMTSFCHQLPQEWRRKRRLTRDFLSYSDLSHSFCNPVLQENFQSLFDQSTSNIIQTAKRMLTTSRLIAGGIVDQNKLQEACKICETGAARKEDHLGLQILLFIRLEKLLHAYS